MAATPVEKHGRLSGTTEVAIVASPTSGIQRIIKTIVVFNDDTVSHTFEFFINDGSSFPYDKVVIPAGDRHTDSDVHILDSTAETITVKYEAAKTTTEPSYYTSCVDVP